MKKGKESAVLAATKRSERKKKRVTFFVTEEAKQALAQWCRDHEISESGAVEQMIREVVPNRYFKESV